MILALAHPPVWRSSRLLLGFLALLWLALYGVRLAGPHDLMDRDQQKSSGYIMDIVKNGHWASQRDANREVMSKPPFFRWIAAGFAYALGGVHRLSMTLPNALAVLGAVVLMYFLGARYFTPAAGFWAGFMYLLSNTTYKQIGLIRTDPILVLTVLGGYSLIFMSWTRGWSWVWFWLVMAASTLTKGPVGLAVSVVSLGAVPWEAYAVCRQGMPAPETRANWTRGHVAGLLLFVLICGSWLLLAWRQDGQDFIDKIFLRELVHHAIGEQGGGDWHRPIRPFLFVLSRFLPWSPVFLVALWRTLKHPSEDPLVRRFERFLFSQFFLGGIVFCLASHKRQDLIWPILPAVSLLTGREFVRWLSPERIRPRRYFLALGVFAALVCTAHLYYEHAVRGAKMQNRRTANAIALANHVRTEVGEDFPLSYAFWTPYGPQYFLGKFQPTMTQQQGDRLLASGTPAFVVIAGEIGLPEMSERVNELYTAKAPWGDNFRIVSNHPRLEWTPVISAISYDIHLTLEGLGLEDPREDSFHLNARTPDWRLELRNLDDEPRRLTLEIAQPAGLRTERVTLSPGESAEFSAAQ